MQAIKRKKVKSSINISNINLRAHCVVIAALFALSVILAHGLHNVEPRLLGYTCKNNARHPCELCPPGFFCTDKKSMFPCGSVDVFCPRGSFKPTPVQHGYYSIGVDDETKRDQQICEAGFIWYVLLHVYGI